MDKHFNIEVLSATEQPQTLVFKALHQCYSSQPVGKALTSESLNEKACGEIIVKRLLAGGRGHYSPLEMATLVLSCKYFNHGTVQQLTRHRTGISFAVQSFRYTSESIIRCAEGSYEDVERAFYLRPVGEYTDRFGSKYVYTEKQRAMHLEHCRYAAQKYAADTKEGIPEEHARDILPFGYRQHFVMGCNARTIMHLLDMRGNKAAQIEAQWFSELLFGVFCDFLPEVAKWYQDNRLGKSKLAP